jgi:hypothetical protein
MYRLAPSRWARRPKHPAKRSRNVPSRSSTARADDTVKFTGHKRMKSQQEVQDPTGHWVTKRKSPNLTKYY